MVSTRTFVATLSGFAAAVLMGGAAVAQSAQGGMGQWGPGMMPGGMGQMGPGMMQGGAGQWGRA